MSHLHIEICQNRWQFVSAILWTDAKFIAHRLVFLHRSDTTKGERPAGATLIRASLSAFKLRALLFSSCRRFKASTSRFYYIRVLLK